MARISTVFALIYQSGLEIDLLIAPFYLQSDQLIVGNIVDAINRTRLDGDCNGLGIVPPLLEHPGAPMFGIHKEGTLSDHGTVCAPNARHLVDVHHLRSDEISRILVSFDRRVTLDILWIDLIIQVHAKASFPGNLLECFQYHIVLVSLQTIVGRHAQRRRDGILIKSPFLHLPRLVRSIGFLQIELNLFGGDGRQCIEPSLFTSIIKNNAVV
mmetsp:Transcript_25526/g.73816  ORF Transcript_25526/g.73816 Transcript_25526/m.73816 type:complete len:213 (-) Transcript_25526:509-1147(-)